MSKILEAECQNNVVKVEGNVVNSTILSNGVGESNGVALLESEKITYMTSNASDIQEAIEKIIEITNKISETLTAIGTAMTGPTTAPPASLPINVADLAVMVAEITELKERLK